MREKITYVVFRGGLPYRSILEIFHLQDNPGVIPEWTDSKCDIPEIFHPLIDKVYSVSKSLEPLTPGEKKKAIFAKREKDHASVFDDLVKYADTVC